MTASPVGHTELAERLEGHLAAVQPGGTPLKAGRGRDAMTCAVLVASVFVLYRGAFAVYFLNEDFTWLRHCSVGPLGALAALVRPDADTQVYSWRPITQLWFGLNYAAWGLHPFGYRLGILAWHALATCVVYAIATRALNRAGGVIAAAVFAAHPLHVEPLSWTCACGAVISSTLSLLAVLAGLRWRSREGPAALVWLLFALALLTQESSIIIPGLIATADILLPGNRQDTAGRLRLYLGLAGVAAAFILLRRVFGPASFNFGMVGLDPRLRMGVIDLLKFVVGKLRATSAAVLLLPAGAGWFALAIVVMIAVAAVWLWRRDRPVTLWGLLWAGVAVAPYTLLLFGPFGRYMHLALAGFGLMFAAVSMEAFDRLRMRAPRLARAAVVALLAVWLAVAARQIGRAQGDFIRNGNLTRALLLDLLREVPDARPGSTFAFYGVGELRQRQGVLVFGLDDAVRLFYGDESLKVAFPPRGPLSNDNYHLLYREGRLERLRRQ